MKKIYDELELEVIRFRTEDIITTSEVMEDTQPETPDADGTPEIDYTGSSEVLSEVGMIFVKPVSTTPDGKTVYINVADGTKWISDSDGTYVSYP